MLLMRAASITWAWGGGGALEIESFLAHVKWHLADRRVPFGAQKTRISILSTHYWASSTDILICILIRTSLLSHPHYLSIALYRTLFPIPIKIIWRHLELRGAVCVCGVGGLDPLAHNLIINVPAATSYNVGII